jgi:hypothetical protein
MRVKCLGHELSEEQRLFFKVPPLFHTRYQITISMEYLVLGITFVVDSPVHGNTLLLEIVNDAGRYSAIPAALFEVTDCRCSSFWQARFYEDGAITMWPAQFYEPYFHDKLSDHDPESRELFESVLTKMRAEFGDWNVQPPAGLQ